MRKLLFFGLMLTLMIGCKKTTNKVAINPQEEDDRKVPSPQKRPTQLKGEQIARGNPVLPRSATSDDQPGPKAPSSENPPAQLPETSAPSKEPSPTERGVPTGVGSVSDGATRTTSEPGKPEEKIPVPENPPAKPPGAEPGPDGKVPPNVEANPGQPGGAGGVAPGVPGAIVRTVNLIQMNNLRIFIETASLTSGRMPTVQEILAAVQQAAPQTHKLLQNGTIVLTGARRRESIWAYTLFPQAGNEHMVLTNSGIERMTLEALLGRIQQQGQ